jgi:hypothetical protein
MLSIISLAVILIKAVLGKVTVFAESQEQVNHSSAQGFC